MPVDEGLRDLYLRRLKDEIEQWQAERARIRERLQLAKLEDDAQALLSAEQNVTLAAAQVVDSLDVSELTAERDRLTAIINAAQALTQAVRSL